MSARIGDVVRDGPEPRSKVAAVSASIGGVEWANCDANFTLSPIQARNAAALLVRASNEVERMRRARGRRK